MNEICPTDPFSLIHRIVVVGTSGSGKTTFARRLAAKLSTRHIELDALHWDADWTEAPIDVFRERVSAATAADRWVADGNYGKVRDVLWARAQMIVWLDYPLHVVLWQLMCRTLKRLVTQEELWSGNKEDWRTQFLTRDSVIYWALATYPRHKREYPSLFGSPSYSHLQIVRFSSAREADEWLAKFAGA